MKWKTIFLMALLIRPSGFAEAEEPLRPDLLQWVGKEEQTSTVGQLFDLHLDSSGFLWIAETSSLSRWDGYRWKEFRADPGIAGSLSNNGIVKIFEASNGDLWFGARSGGVERYRPSLESFNSYPPGDGLPDGVVWAMSEDSQGFIWIATSSGLGKLDPTTGSTVRLAPCSAPTSWVISVFTDSSGDVWASSENCLSRYKANGDVVEYRKDEPGGPPDHIVLSFYEDSTGALWMGANYQYLFRFDPRLGDFEVFTHGRSAPINSIEEDESGRLWLGLLSGLLYFDQESGTFSPYRTAESSGSLIRKVQKDSSGILWVATADGLGKIDLRWNRFSVLRQGEAENGDLLNPTVMAFTEAKDGALWIGHRSGLSRVDRAAGSALHLVPGEGEHGLPDQQIFTLTEGPDGNIWIGTKSGLGRLSTETLRFEPAEELQGKQVRWLYRDRKDGMWIATYNEIVRWHSGGLETPVSLSDSTIRKNVVYRLYEDRSDRLWIATLGGLFRLDEGGRLVKYSRDPRDKNSLSADMVSDMYQDEEGVLWVATYGGGLSYWREESETWGALRARNGLPDDHLTSLLPDEHGNLWIGTRTGGIVRFDPRAEVFKAFSAEDGVGSARLTLTSSLRLSTGELAFAGYDGLTLFRSQALDDLDPTPPRIAFTELLINHEISPIGAAESPHDRSILDLESLVLRPEHRNFSVEMAPIHLREPRQNRVEYRLDPYDESWIRANMESRLAAYTGLDPGSYVLRARAISSDGVYSDERSLKIDVLPPWWRSTAAYVAYALLICGALWNVNRNYQRKLRAERQINKQLQELNELKDDFLANTSHELRTPLYGISGLAESALTGRHGELSPELAKDLSLIVSSAGRLSNLVNDILDFSKAQRTGIELRLSTVSLHSVTDVVLTHCRPLTANKSIELRNSVGTRLEAEADESRVQQILHNLVANAIKFTEQGSVEVGARRVAGQLEVWVRDTGPGIPEENQKKIFRAFEQGSRSIEREHGGTGLGLAISRQLVERHGGRLWLDSVAGEGATFYFTLPAARADREFVEDAPGSTYAVPLEELAALAPLPQSSTATYAHEEGSDRQNLGHLLVVDDDSINLRILETQLTAFGYTVTAVESGQSALEVLEHAEPPIDLVLLDVMMPRMSGYETCRLIRERLSREKLPVLFLTARSQVEDRVTGFAEGANDYLIKPVAQDELLARVGKELELVVFHRNLEEKVDTLSGLLPICASCKKIRDDGGYWNQLETYFSSHSEVDFSHGICPECANTLYPELAEDLSV